MVVNEKGAMFAFCAPEEIALTIVTKPKIVIKHQSRKAIGKDSE